MKKLFSLLFPISLLLAISLFTSCNQDVGPVEFEERYVLNCVIKVDTTYQVATLSRSYSTNLLEQGGRSEDYNISGAKITLTCTNQNGSVTYNFRDTTVSGNISSGLPTRFYYIKNFKPSIDRQTIFPPYVNYNNYAMTIVATLPNGKKIGSYSYSVIYDSANFDAYRREKYLFPPYSGWKFNTQAGKFFTTGHNAKTLPELIIKYEKLENSIWNKKNAVIPINYVTSKNGEVHVYPVINFDDSKQFVSYDSLMIVRTLEKISDGDSNKKNYKITGIQFVLDLMSEGFANYVAAQQTYSMEFSHRIVPAVYTNIAGGLGVFGAMCSIRRDMPYKEWSQSLGYLTN